MGLRFRKSIKIAPGVKVNLNKNSTSVSIGTKGKHYTVNSKGKTTKTVGIPGTGLSYSTTSGGTTSKKTSKKTKVSAVKKSNRRQSKPKKKGGCLTSCLVVFVALILIFAMSPSKDKKGETEELPKQQIAKEQISQDAAPQSEDDNDEDVSGANAEQTEQEQIAAEQAEQERIAAEQAEQERIAQEQAEAARIAQEQAEAERIAQEQAQNSANNFNAYDNAYQQQMTNSYVLNTSTMKFHSPGCKDVKKIAPQNYSTYDGTRDGIINQGYSPCGHCNP